MKILKTVERLRGRGYEIVQILRAGAIMNRSEDNKTVLVDKQGKVVMAYKDKVAA